MAKKRRPIKIDPEQSQVSGQFLLTMGTLFAVVVSFVLSAGIAGLGARPVFLISLFILFFMVLFIPISIAVRPKIDRDAIAKYLKKIEEQVKRWEFEEKDLCDLKMLRQHLRGKENKNYIELLQRVVLVLSEIEKIERAKADFFWDTSPDGPLH